MEAGLKINGRYKIRKWKAGTKELIFESPWIKNRIVSSSGYGRNLIMRALAGDLTYGVEIDSAAIGTGSNVPTDANTNLQTPVLTGILVALTEISNDVLTISFFIPDASLANGTYTEFGMFCGTQLFARSLISPSLVKASGEDWSVDYELTLNAA